MTTEQQAYQRLSIRTTLMLQGDISLLLSTAQATGDSEALLRVTAVEVALRRLNTYAREKAAEGQGEGT